MAEAGTDYLKPFILLACHSPSAGAELQRSPVLQPCPDRLPEDRGSMKPPPAQGQFSQEFLKVFLLLWGATKQKD